MNAVTGSGFGAQGGFWMDEFGARFGGIAQDTNAGRIQGVATLDQRGFAGHAQGVGPGGPIQGDLVYDRGRDTLNLSWQSPFGSFQTSLPVPPDGPPPPPPPPHALAFLNGFFPGLFPLR